MASKFLERQTAVADALPHAMNGMWGDDWRARADALMEYLSRQGYSIQKIDQDFEEVPEVSEKLGQDIHLERSKVCGGVIIKATVIDVPDLGKRPALVYQFYTADGVPLTPIIFLTVDLAQFLAIKGLTYQAVNAAVNAMDNRNGG